MLETTTADAAASHKAVIFDISKFQLQEQFMVFEW
jgi:hypothetical protein